MTELAKRRRALIADQVKALHGYTLVGTPSISSGILDLSVKGAIKTPFLFSPGATDTWRIEWAVNWTLQPTDDAYHYLIATQETPSSSLASEFFVAFRVGGTRVSLKVGGTTIINFTLGAQAVNTGENLFSLSFTGTKYQFRNITRNVGRSGSSTAQMPAFNVYFGNNANTNQQSATMDLSKIKIYLNNKLWWTP